MINSNDFSLLIQLLDSMDQASRELEKALNNRNVERFNILRKEIIKFHLQVNEVLA